MWTWVSQAKNPFTLFPYPGKLDKLLVPAFVRGSLTVVMGRQAQKSDYQLYQRVSYYPDITE